MRNRSRHPAAAGVRPGRLRRSSATCESLHAAIDLKTAAIWHAGDHDWSGLADLDATVRSLTAELKAVIRYVKSENGRKLFESNPGLLDEVFTWVSNAYWSVCDIESYIMPDDEEQEEGSWDPEELRRDSVALSRLMGKLRVFIMQNYPHLLPP